MRECGPGGREHAAWARRAATGTAPAALH